MTDSKESEFGTNPLVQDDFDSLKTIIDANDWSYISEGNPTQSQYNQIQFIRDQAIADGDLLQASLDAYDNYTIPRIDVNEVLTTWLGYTYDPVDDVHKVDPSVDVDQNKLLYLEHFRGILDSGPLSDEIKEDVILGLRVAINHKISREYWKARAKSLPSQAQYDSAITERDQARNERDARPTQASYDAVVAERNATAALYDMVVAERNAAVAERDEILAENYGKLSLNVLKNLVPGSSLIQVENNEATLSIVTEESSDLNRWTEASTKDLTFPASTGTKLYRLNIEDSESLEFGKRDYFAGDNLETYSVPEGFTDKYNSLIISNKADLLQELDSSMADRTRVFIFDLKNIESAITDVKFKAFIKPIDIGYSVPLGDHSTDDTITIAITGDDFDFINDQGYVIPLGSGIGETTSIFEYVWDHINVPSDVNTNGAELELDFSDFDTVSHTSLIDGVTTVPGNENTSLINEINFARYICIGIADDTDVDYVRLEITTNERF